jgi:hypothetical protein
VNSSWIARGVVGVVVALALSACGDSSGESADTTQADSGAGPTAPVDGELDGVETFRLGSASHVDGSVSYDQSPPVGGDHNPAWQNCGFYGQVIANENAVHSLEHGVIWFTYQAGTSEADLAALRSRADNDTHILVSQYDDQQSPFVLTAWARQLAVDSLDDPRVDDFVEAYIRGGESPEPGALCSRGVGEPLDSSADPADSST